MIYTDRSIAAITDEQAASTVPILPANPHRERICIIPTFDGRLCLTPGGAGFGWPMKGGANFSLSGDDCPTNELYVAGMAPGSPIAIADMAYADDAEAKG